MDAVRHDADLDRRDPQSGTTRRAILEEKARRGDAFAPSQLAGPPYPDALLYLDEWSCDLYGRSGVGMGGFAPLSYTTIRDWAALTGNNPTPLEVTALMQLDAIRRAPEPEDAPPADVPLTVAPWPTKRQEG
jgi:hypothetical protein